MTTHISPSSEELPFRVNLQDVAIDLEVTSVCDAVCGFCPREHMPDKKKFIQMAVVERLAEDLRRNQMLIVVLCGIGESTLHPQLDEIVRTLAGTRTKLEMTTHGGERMDARRFETLVKNGLTGFNFSLNAFTGPTHRKVMRLKNFEKTIANLQDILLLKSREYPHVTVNVSFVVCSQNAHEAIDFVNFWRPQPVTKVWLHPLNNRAGLLSPDVQPVDVNALAARYARDERVLVDVFGHVHEEDHLCKIAKKMIFISVEGEMRLCAMDYRRVTSYGNLLNERLDQMHRGKLLRYLRGDLDEFCSVCGFCPSGIRSRQGNALRG